MATRIEYNERRYYGDRRNVEIETDDKDVLDKILAVFRYMAVEAVKQEMWDDAYKYIKIAKDFEDAIFAMKDDDMKHEEELKKEAADNE